VHRLEKFSDLVDRQDSEIVERVQDGFANPALRTDACAADSRDPYNVSRHGHLPDGGRDWTPIGDSPHIFMIDKVTRA
jgi:hypothetical protein